MRLIDTDSLKYRRKDYGGYDDVGEEERKRGILFLLKEDIDTATTIEAEPIKHGHWINTGSGQECSVCGEIQYGHDSFRNYCAYCGAKMDDDDWEEPEINPCRGCDDYDGRGGCKSHGDCGVKMSNETN